jgi:hypothetical protein
VGWFKRTLAEARAAAVPVPKVAMSGAERARKHRAKRATNWSKQTKQFNIIGVPR